MASMHTIFDKQVTVRLLRERLDIYKADEDSLILALMSATAVDLSASGLTGISGLDVCYELVNVNLACNEITDLDFATLEMLYGLRFLNLQQNLLTGLPDLSYTWISELNVAFNPMSALDPAYLPKGLHRISITGTQIARDSIVAVFPEIELFEAEKIKFEHHNEVEEALQAAGQKQVTEDDVIAEHNKAYSVPEKPKTATQTTTRVAKLPKVQTPQRNSYNAQKFHTPQQLPYLAYAAQDLYADEMRDMVGKYEEALGQVDALNIDDYTKKVEQMIQNSYYRAEKDFNEVRQRLYQDQSAIDARKVQMEALLDYKIKELYENASEPTKKPENDLEPGTE